jgi:hypothetical protein
MVRTTQTLLIVKGRCQSGPRSTTRTHSSGQPERQDLSCKHPPQQDTPRPAARATCVTTSPASETATT